MASVVYKYNNLSYTLTALRNNCLRLEWRNNDYHFTKIVKAVSDPSTVFELQKTQIKARGGADGLVEFIADCISQNLGVCWVDKIIDWIIKDCKAIQFYKY